MLRESHRPGIEPATCKSQVQRPTAEPPRNTIVERIPPPPTLTFQNLITSSPVAKVGLWLTKFGDNRTWISARKLLFTNIPIIPTYLYIYVPMQAKHINIPSLSLWDVIIRKRELKTITEFPRKKRDIDQDQLATLAAGDV